MRTMVVGLFLAIAGLLVATHATTLGGPDEIVATLRVGHCTVSLVERPALVMYAGVFVEVRRSDSTRLVRERITTVDQPGDAAHMVLRRVGSGSVAVYRGDDEVGHVGLPDDCTSPAESPR